MVDPGEVASGVMVGEALWHKSTSCSSDEDKDNVDDGDDDDDDELEELQELKVLEEEAPAAAAIAAADNDGNDKEGCTSISNFLFSDCDILLLDTTVTWK